MRREAFVAAILAAALTLGGASAQTSPADPFAPGAADTKSAAPEAGAKPEPKKAKPAKRKPSAGGELNVVVNNKRSVGLVELTVGPSGEANPKKVAGPLAFGRKTTIRLKRAKDCLYDIRGHFADDADTEQLGVDLCKDKVINLED